jgi:hypothetical protein
MALFQASGGCMKKCRAMVFAGAMFALAVSTRAFDTQWHADATPIAMERNGFSSDARLLCQFTNYLTDYFSAADLDKEVYERLPPEMPRVGTDRMQGIDIADVARLQFDALTSHPQVEQQWARLEANTSAALVKWAAEPSVKSGYRLHRILFLSLGDVLPCAAKYR